jgi:hypothetical protein
MLLMCAGQRASFYLHKYLKNTSPPILHSYVPKGTVSRDNFYSIFLINHILLVLQEVLYEDFKFCRIFTVLFNYKGSSPV